MDHASSATSPAGPLSAAPEGAVRIYLWLVVEAGIFLTETLQAESSEDGITWTPIGGTITITSGGPFFADLEEAGTSTGSTQFRATAAGDATPIAMGIDVTSAECAET